MGVLIGSFEKRKSLVLKKSVFKDTLMLINFTIFAPNSIFIKWTKILIALRWF